MSSTKTAISLDKETLKQVDQRAKEAQISRSRLISLAVQEYLQKLENGSVLAELNKAYQDQPTEEENELLQAVQGRHKSLLEKDPW